MTPRDMKAVGALLVILGVIVGMYGCYGDSGGSEASGAAAFVLGVALFSVARFQE